MTKTAGLDRKNPVSKVSGVRAEARVEHLKAYADQPSSNVSLTMGRGMGWRGEISVSNTGYYLHLGKSEVTFWKPFPGVRALRRTMEGEDFRRIYLTGKVKDDVQQSAASLRELVPYNPYTGHGRRTWEDSLRPRKMMKKAK